MASMTSELIVRLRDMASAPARAIGQNLGRLRAIQAANAREMDQMRGRMLDATAAAYALYRGISAPVQSAIAFESAMADVRKVVDFPTPQAFQEMNRDIIEMSTRLPMAATDIAAIVAAAGQADIAGQELLTFAEMATKVGVAFDMPAEQTGTALAQIKTQLQTTVEATGELADAINHLSNNTASAAPDLIEYMARAAAFGEQYGFSAAQTAALGSAMIASGAQANVAATSLRSVGRALTRGTSASKRQREAMERLGLSTTEVAKRMQKDAVGTLRDVLARLRELPEHMQAATMSDLFGDEARAFAPLLNNLELYDNALELVADRTNYLGSAQKEYEARAATTANNLQLLRNKVEAMSIAIGSALLPAINAIADAIGPAIMAFAGFAEQHPQIVQAAVAITAALVGMRIATIGARFAFLFLKGGLLDFGIIGLRAAGGILALLNPMNTVKAAAIALRTALLLTGVGAAVAALAAAGVWIYNNWDGLVAFFQGFGEGVMAGLEPLMPVIRPIVDSGKELLGWVSGLLGPIDATNTEWKEWGRTIGGTVADAINTVIGLFEKLVGWITGAVEAAQNFGNAVGSFLSGGEPQPSGAANNRRNQRHMPGSDSPQLAGSRAAGGRVLAGYTYQVNERGTEMFTPGADGYIHNAEDSRRFLEGAGGNAAAPVSRTVNTGDIILHLHGVTDPRAIAENIGEAIKDELRGLYSDLEWSAG